MVVFWVVAPRTPVEVYRRFRGACCLHHQTTRRNNPEDSRQPSKETKQQTTYFLWNWPKNRLWEERMTMKWEPGCRFEATTQFPAIFHIVRGMDCWSLIPDRGKDFLYSPLRPDRLRDPSNLLSIGYRGSEPQSDYSPPSTMHASLPPAPPYACIALCCGTGTTLNFLFHQ
jgi:hypothetical protein